VTNRGSGDAANWIGIDCRRTGARLGEWMSIEIANRNGHLTASLNGVKVLDAQNKFTKPGYMAIQAQGTALQWRNIRIKED
jgi:hypothetical protein